MTIFLQLHLLTSYPPACLNRDDLNRPKTAVMGGVPRLRVSSQSLKRAWRTSSYFESAFKGKDAGENEFTLDAAETWKMGVRTKLMGVKIYERLIKGNIDDTRAKAWASAISGQFGKLKGKKEGKPLNDLEIEQLAHFSPGEVGVIRALTERLIAQKQDPSDTDLDLLRKEHKATDLALFGRMLADSPGFNVEAACQVAHAITVHRAVVDDDFFTAVDDLNTRVEDAGSAHMGEQGFGAGLFYLYICIDCDLLKGNLDGDSALPSKAIKALIEAAATVAPTGKQNSFASRAWASYVLAEKGSRQPRSLSMAFLKPVRDGDMLADAVTALESMRDNLDKVYHGGESLPFERINALEGKGDFQKLLSFAAG